MGLFDFLKQPKWKSSKSSVRLAAVKDMDSAQQETLLEIIREDTDSGVRLAALAQINDQQSLELLLKEKLSDDLVEQGRKKLQVLYANLILSSPENCQPELLINKITDQELLAEIAFKAESVDLRVKAVEAMNDPGQLCELLKQPCGKKPALAAVKKISDPLLLAEVAQKAANKAARKQAALKLKPEKQMASSHDEKITTAPVPTDENNEKTPLNVDKELQRGRDLCDEIDVLCTTMEDNADITFAGIIKKWPDFGPADQQEDVRLLQKRYQELCIKFSATRKEFLDEKNRLSSFSSACEQAEKLLRKDNLAGAETLLDDTIAELENTNWHWLNSTDLTQRFLNFRQELEQRKDELTVIAQTENDNLQAVTDICAEMEQLAEEKDRYKLGKKASKTTSAWKKIPEKVKQEHPEIIARFQTALDKFEDKQQKFYEEQEWQLWNNKTKKEELYEKVAALQDETDLHQVAKTLKEYQAAWKTIGPVPKKDSNKLWQDFTTVCDEVYARCREFYTELDHKRQECTTIKEEFCAQAEQHTDSSNWKESADFLKDLQKKWKEVGPAERSKEQDLYTRFRAACDQFFDRRSEFFSEQDVLRQENLKAKEALCLEVEELVQDPKMEYGRTIQEIQKRWKTIGPVPRKFDEEIWLRFRGSCDAYYSWLDELRLKNLQQKVALCELVEALQPKTEDETISQETIDTVIALQKQWKTIGPVPRDKADELWQRFTTTCDIFFVERKIRQQQEEKKRIENQEAKEEILRLAGEAMALPDQSEITAKLKELQQQWKQIGPAPREHDQLLWDEFHGLCNAFFQEKRDRYLEKTAVLEENLKKKEELCFQLERLAGQKTDPEKNSVQTGLDLVEQFKIAREANFLLAGKTKNTQTKREEVRRIQQEWKTVGTTFREKEQNLWKRYRTAIDKIYSDNSPRTTRQEDQPAKTDNSKE